MLGRVVSKTRGITTGYRAVTWMRPVNARGYHENIVDHYENPRNVGSLDKNDPNVGTVCHSEVIP